MGNFLPWVRAATPLTLPDKELHVWRASLDFSPALLERMAKTLSANENERADKFLIARARERFVAARGILRHLLGMYLGLHADKIDFSMVLKENLLLRRRTIQGCPSAFRIRRQWACLRF